MTISIVTVSSSRQLDQFIKFPWLVNREDSNWVPPLIKERRNKLDIHKNPFWKTAQRTLFMAMSDGQPVGTIAAIVDHYRNQCLNKKEGIFGFFDCLNDQSAADCLFKAAESWVKSLGMKSIQGPYNPSPTDECGILVEGFQTRPSLLEAHNPPYYKDLVEGAGYSRERELVARKATAQGNIHNIEEVVPTKLLRVVEMIRQRSDIKIRKVNLRGWDEDVSIACSLYNQALKPLPDYIPVPEDDFKAFANDFKTILDPELALVAEIQGKPVGFALALPDITRALQIANGHLGLIGMTRIWLELRKPTRCTFKILMILPEYQNRGIETLLILGIIKTAYEKGYREMDISLTGSENEKSNRFQENLGYQVYRRYFMYKKQFTGD